MSVMLKLTHCLNCQTDLESQDLYCSKCGQRTHDGKNPVIHILKDFLVDQLNLDGRLWRSIKLLLLPGRLTTEYFAGLRKSQINPFKLFFIVALLSFTLLSILAKNPVQNNGLGELVWFTDQEQSFQLLDSLAMKLPEQFPEGEYPGVANELLKLVRGDLNIGSDTVDLNEHITIGLVDQGPFLVSVRDFNSFSTDSLINKYSDQSIIDKLFMRQKIKMFKDPKSLQNFVTSNLVWILAVFIPIIALVLKLIYYRRRRFYVEHLVFSLHLHTAFLVILSLALIPTTRTGNSNFLLVGLGIFSIFLFISLYRYYQQSIGRSLLKYFILHITYPFLFFYPFEITAGIFISHADQISAASPV